jgi:hypothetical protein
MSGRLRLLPVVSLLACTTAPVDEPAQAVAPASPAVAPASPAPTVEPAAPVTAPVATPKRWWCLCYHSLDGDISPTTECLADAVKCEARVAEVARGTADILDGSLTHACVEVVGEHPSQVHGGTWRASNPPGDWRSAGACRLPGAGLRSGLQAAAEARLFEESLGAVMWAMDASEAVAAFGAPKRGRKVALPDLGAPYFTQQWRFPRHGLGVQMVEGGGDQVIFNMEITAPSTLTTKQGIHIGSTRAEVLSAYGVVLDEDRLAAAETAPEVDIGSDRMLSFTFAGDTVRKIAITGGWD